MLTLDESSPSLYRMGKGIIYKYTYPFITGWWFGTFFIFPYIGNVIIPTDEVHDFSEGLKPTTNQIIMQHDHLKTKIGGTTRPDSSLVQHDPTWMITALCVWGYFP